jgi:hypothetical protein
VGARCSRLIVKAQYVQAGATSSKPKEKVNIHEVDSSFLTNNILKIKEVTIGGRESNA